MNPKGELAVFPSEDQVLLPGGEVSLDVEKPELIRLFRKVASTPTRRLLVLPAGQRMGVEAELIALIEQSKSRVVVELRGVERRLADGSPVEERLTRSANELVAKVRAAAEDLSELSETPALKALESDDPGRVADAAAFHFELPPSVRLQVLDELDVIERLKLVLGALDARRRTEETLAAQSAQQREEILRARKKEILAQLGETDDESADDVWSEKIKLAKMPPEIESMARKQARRLAGIGEGSPEAGVARTYLEWLTELPWSKRTEDRIDVPAARALLEADHQGLDKVKRRVLEYLAVRKLNPGKKGPILCLAGPPGVGKTSLGRSIARALGREFVRLSLGGVRDEAEIRGHRRTYIGALPGRILSSLRQARSKNPVFMLDEIDKLASDFRGDPAAAMLEVLATAQNDTFTDHYLEVPFDLSEVIFIATANQLSTIPAPLRDRLEILTIPGYPLAEKRAIAERHLLPKQLLEHGLTAAHLHLTSEAIDEIITGYTREAGVRNLERQLAAVVRAVTVKVASRETYAANLTADGVAGYLGPPRYESEVAELAHEPGVSTGLAWTPSGGEILFIEATRMRGSGRLVLTGQLGDVMRESATAALSYVRANGARWGIAPEVFESSDLHVHFPSGGTPKDGPSAGNAIVAALVSLLTGRSVRGDVAMTGEITLRGAVLPVGGIADKVLAAHRAGIKRVILPERNAKDLVDVPAEVRRALDVVLVKRIDEMLAAALTDVAAPLQRPAPVTVEFVQVAA